jgi:hypothetical protein
MSKPLDFYHTRGMQRTSQNLKEDVVKNDFGVSAQPLVSIEPEHIIIDQLHLLLRICDKLLRNLTSDTKTFRFTFGQKRVLKVNWNGRHWRDLTLKSFWKIFLQNYAFWSIMIPIIILSKFGVHFWIYIVSWRSKYTSSLTLKIFLKNVKGG